MHTQAWSYLSRRELGCQVREVDVYTSQLVSMPSPPSFEAVNSHCLTFSSGLPLLSSFSLGVTSLPVGFPTLLSCLLLPSLLPHLCPELGLCKMRSKFAPCLYLHLALLPQLCPLYYSPVPTFSLSSLLSSVPYKSVLPSARSPGTSCPARPYGSSQQPWARCLSSRHSWAVCPLARSPQSCVWFQHQVPPSSYSVHIHPSPDPPQGLLWHVLKRGYF